MEEAPMKDRNFFARNRRPVLSAFIILLFASVFGRAAVLPTAKPSEVGLSAERLERMTKVFQDYVDQGRVAGVVTLVARKGRA
jgi:hypothetical protein